MCVIISWLVRLHGRSRRAAGRRGCSEPTGAGRASRAVRAVRLAGRAVRRAGRAVRAVRRAGRAVRRAGRAVRRAGPAVRAVRPAVRLTVHPSVR